MNKHTPGPWVVDHGGTKGHIKSISRSLTPIGKGTKNEYIPTPTICRYDGVLVVADTLTKQEKQANARLIAAAPEMLEALESARDTISYLKKYVMNQGLSAEMDAAEEIENIERVLQSATGENIEEAIK